MKKTAIIKELKDKLNNNLNCTIKEVILFGSQASNEAKEYSDYDILIIVDANLSSRLKNQIITICYDIELKYDILTDIHILSTNELNTLRGKQPVFTNAIHNGIHV
jgi:predicted nucleotidyltransferase